MISPLSLCYYVSMSVGKYVFSKAAHKSFLKLLVKLGCYKGNNLTGPIFGKNHILGMSKNTTEIVFFFPRKNSPLMCRIFGFKSCTIMIFMILLKPHVWEKSYFQVKYKNALDQSVCRIFKL